jgi:hypothetical protein
MTPARAERLVRDLTNVQAKVFHAVPVQEAWADTTIMQELRRQGSNVAMDVIRGCLETLRRLNLIREPEPRHFQQINHHMRADGTPKEYDDMATPEHTTTTHRPKVALDTPALTGIPNASKVSALDRIARIAITLADIARELEDVAIQVDEDLKGAGKDSEDLRQLRDLLGRFAK